MDRVRLLHLLVCAAQLDFARCFNNNTLSVCFTHCKCFYTLQHKRQTRRLCHHTLQHKRQPRPAKSRQPKEESQRVQARPPLSRPVASDNGLHTQSHAHRDPPWLW